MTHLLRTLRAHAQPTLVALSVLGVVLPVRAQVLPALAANLINRYTFDHPLGGDPLSPTELDLGSDATNITLFNGAPRVADAAWRGSTFSLETAQRDTGANDDWKAGVMFPSSAVSTLQGTRHVTGVTIMGWFKPLGAVGDNPSLNTNTPDPLDRYNAFGLVGYLRGDGLPAGTVDGHAVRALLEVIGGKVTALGRRLDSQSGSGSRASIDDWHVVMPPGRWTHLTATIGFDAGALALYKNGLPLAVNAGSTANWQLTAGVDFTSDTAAAGIKIAGSYPDDSQEFNPFNGRSDELMMFNKTLTAAEVLAQFQLVSDVPGDYNRSGAVDGADFVAWQRTLGSTVDLLADGNRDGTVNVADLDVWRQNFGQAAATAASLPTPEPTTALLAALALASLSSFRRTR